MTRRGSDACDSNGGVHLWWASTQGAPTRLPPAGLDAAESVRAARMRPADRKLFVLAHSLMRDVLGRYLDGPVVIDRGTHGKPHLVDGGDDLEFNLSYSEDLVVCAVSWDGPVGVDVEAVRPVDGLMDIARHFFTEAEYHALQANTGRARLDLFYRLWTFKEASLKAHGADLESGLALAIPLADAKELGPRRVVFEDSRVAYCREIQVRPGYAVGLATAEASVPVRVTRWSGPSRPLSVTAGSPVAG